MSIQQNGKRLIKMINKEGASSVAGTLSRRKRACPDLSSCNSDGLSVYKSCTPKTRIDLFCGPYCATCGISVVHLDIEHRNALRCTTCFVWRPVRHFCSNCETLFCVACARAFECGQSSHACRGEPTKDDNTNLTCDSTMRSPGE